MRFEAADVSDSQGIIPLSRRECYYKSRVKTKLTSLWEPICPLTISI